MRKLIAAFTIGASICGWMLKRAFENNMQSVTINMERFSAGDELSIFFISDIHRRKISKKWLDSLPNTHLIVVGGDIMEKGVPYSRVERNVALLSEKCPVIFVYGNNDEEVDRERLRILLEKYNVTILENEAIQWKLGEDRRVWIAGIGDIGYEKDNLELALSQISLTDPVILLSHNPMVIDQINTPGKKIDLVLSGHTHGGQIRFFGIGPYELGGISITPLTTQLISNGFGTTLLPFRLGAKAETHLITLKKGMN